MLTMGKTGPPTRVKTVYGVLGMHCASCAESIRKALMGQLGIDQVEVSFAAETLSLCYDPQLQDFASLARLVTAAGYQLQQPVVAGEPAPAVGVSSRPAIPLLPLLLLIPLEAITMGRHFFYPLLLADQPLLLMLLQLLLAGGIFWCARKLVLNGVQALRRGRPNMNSLIAIATSTALGYSIYLSAGMLWGEPMLVDHLAYEAGSLVLFFVLLGNYCEERVRRRGRGAVSALVELQPQTARLNQEGGGVEVAVADLRRGDVVIVRPGERVPADGKVLEGEPWLDQSIITGESLPVQKMAGDEVLTGVLNQASPFLLQVGQVGENTALARIISMVLQAQSSQMPINRLADRISGVFVPIVMALALLSGVVWYLITRDLATALDRFVAVLIISCPCALGLASPMAVMVAIGKGMRLGFIVRHGEILEKVKSIDEVVFDKTGTLTLGKPQVSEVMCSPPFSLQQVLELAASGESYSEHPLAQAVLEHCRNQGYHAAELQNFVSLSGRGISYDVGHHHCLLGSLSYLKEEGVALLQLEQVERLQHQGKTLIALAVDQNLAGIIAVRDPLKKSAGQAVQRLQQLGYAVTLLSGDNQRTADAIAAELGIKRVIADVLPEEKQRVVASLQGEGRRVLMVGDGVNDAPALAQAEVGIAMGGGSHLAHESGAVILMNNDPRSVVQLLQLGRSTVRIIKQNLFWAFAYNMLALPLAAGVLVPLGFPGVSPVVAAPLMTLSSISVVRNALRLDVMAYN